MTYIESPTKTVERFVSSWRTTGTDRLTQEIISTFNETNRKPDEYKFKFKDGELVDFQTEIKINIDTGTYLGKKDKEVLDALSCWVSENENGTAVWISPSFESVYPCNKITTYKLETNENGEKSTFNTTILFDTPKEHTLEIARKLNPAFNKTNDPETLRNKIIVFDENLSIENIFELIGIEKDIPHITPSQHIVSYFVDLIHSGFDAEYIAQQMEEKGVIGKFSVSCGGANSSSLLESNSLTLNLTGLEDRYGSLSFSCPKCGATNTRPFGQLLSHCQHCGGDVRC